MRTKATVTDTGDRRVKTGKRYPGAFGKSFLVGFSHKLCRGSEEAIDTELLTSLEVKPFVHGPYSLEFPRHITSVLPVTLDWHSVRMFDLGLRLGRSEHTIGGDLMERVGAEIANSTKKVQSNRKKRLGCEIIDVFPIQAGLGVAATVNCAYISEVRGTITQTLKQVGVPVPDMHDPHVTIARATDRRTARHLLGIAECLIGIPIEYEPVEPYYGMYTEMAVARRIDLDEGNSRISYDYI